MTKVTVLKNGPVLVKGELEITDADGNEYGLGGKNQVALCRCGHSGVKPFCDGSHNKEEFEHEPQAFDLN